VEQTEQLLWLACRLQLEPIVRWLHKFILPLCWFFDFPVAAGTCAVFSERVLEAAAAGVANLQLSGGKEMLINTLVGEMAVLTSSGMSPCPAVATVLNFSLKPQNLLICSDSHFGSMRRCSAMAYPWLRPQL
jgi:hypothetical protein